MAVIDMTMDRREVIAVTGPDRETFLQSIVTNDISGIAGRCVYAALLTPQGKYLVDFFVSAHEESLLIDVAGSVADLLASRLSLYRLRSHIEISRTGLKVERGLGTPPDGAYADPRHPTLGWRRITEIDSGTEIDFDPVRVRHCVPETGVELIQDKTYILEAGFERLNGVDFSKGCYVGQEVTARMKHKTELKKKLLTVAIKGHAAIGTDIRSEDRTVGTVFTQADGIAIAYLRMNRTFTRLHAGEAEITLLTDQSDEG